MTGPMVDDMRRCGNCGELATNLDWSGEACPGCVEIDWRHVAFTLGNATSYRYDLAGPDPVYKQGRQFDCDYPGGSVWTTPDQVWAYIDSTDLPFAPAECYELELPAPFDECTSPTIIEGARGSWHDLLVDALIIREVPRP